MPRCNMSAPRFLRLVLAALLTLATPSGLAAEAAPSPATAEPNSGKPLAPWQRAGLKAVFAHEDENVKLEGIRLLLVLEEDGYDLSEFMETLLQRIKAGDRNTKSIAPYALGKIGPKAASAVPALIKLLEDGGSHATILGAMAGLGHLGEKAASAVPELIKLIDPKNDDGIAEAAEALGNIGEKAAAAVPALVKLLEFGYIDEKSFAAQALAKIGEKAPSTVPELLRMLESPVSMTRGSAAEALELMGEQAAAAVPALAKLLESRDPATRQLAGKLLLKIGKPASEAFSSLVRASLTEGLEFPREVTALVGPSCRGLYLCRMLYVKRKKDDDYQELMEQATAFVARNLMLREDPSIFMILCMDIDPHNSAKVKAWFLYQTAVGGPLRWLLAQMEGKPETEPANAVDKASRLRFLKETLDQVRDNPTAKELFPEAYGKLLLRLEAIAP